MTKMIDTARMTIDIDQATHKTLKYMAIKEGKSLRAVVLDAIEQMLVNNKDKNGNTEVIEQ